MDELLDELGMPSAELEEAGVNPQALAAGMRIRQARLSLGWTQKALADKVGITQPQLSDIEAGKGKIGAGISRIRQLEIALGLNPGKAPCGEVIVSWHRERRRDAWLLDNWKAHLPSVAMPIPPRPGFIEPLMDKKERMFIYNFVHRELPRVRSAGPGEDVPGLIVNLGPQDSVSVNMFAATVLVAPGRHVEIADHVDHIIPVGGGSIAIVGEEGLVHLTNPSTGPQAVYALPGAGLSG